MVRSAGKATIETRPAPAGPAPRPARSRQIRLKAPRPVAFPGQAGTGRGIFILTVESELLEAFRVGKGGDLIRESVRLVMQDLIEVDAAESVGTGRYERAESRTTERNGTRPRRVSSQAGDIELKIPKLRQGSFFPSLWRGAAASTKPCMRW